MSEENYENKKTFGISNELLESKNVNLKDVIKKLSKRVEKITSNYLANYGREKVKAKAILIGENCISIDTHWLLTTTKLGFRGIIMGFIQELSKNNGSKPEEPLEEQLVSNGILVTDCMKFVLSPTTYKKKVVWDEVFSEGYDAWEKSLAPKIGENITVGFAYKRVYDRFTQNEQGKKWLSDNENKISRIIYYNGQTQKWNKIKVSKPQ